MTNKSENDLIPTLASLGYERKQIMTILDKINTEEPFDLQLKQALKLLLERG